MDNSVKLDTPPHNLGSADDYIDPSRKWIFVEAEQNAHGGDQ